MEIEELINRLRGRVLAILYNEDAAALREAITILERVKRLEELCDKEIQEDQDAKPWSSGPYINADDLLEYLKTGKEW
jgi:hypothetical protein